jgi:acyl carrier protein
MPDPRVVDALLRAVDEINLTCPADARVGRSLDTRLLGPDGALDSLGIVNLIVAVEEHVEMAFGASVNLADRRALEQGESPLATLGSLATYVDGLLREQGRL